VLQYPSEGGVTGQRFDAFGLAEQVRRNGWNGEWQPSLPQPEGVNA
jgi:hypothetical protein